MPWYLFVWCQLQDALGVCNLTTRENSAPLLNELLRGTNAADFSNNYFRQHNFRSLAPGFALHESSRWMPGLLKESCFSIHVRSTFLSLCSLVAVTAKRCWPGRYRQPWPPSFVSKSRWLGFFDCLSLVCRLCIRPGYLLSLLPAGVSSLSGEE